MFGKPTKMGFGQPLKGETGPRRGVNPVPGEQQALFVARAVDQHVVFAVAGKQRCVAFDIEMQFHMAGGVQFAREGRLR